MYGLMHIQLYLCVFKMDTLTLRWSSIVSSASSHSTSGISTPNNSISTGCWNRFLLPGVISWRWLVGVALLFPFHTSTIHRPEAPRSGSGGPSSVTWKSWGKWRRNVGTLLCPLMRRPRWIYKKNFLLKISAHGFQALQHVLLVLRCPWGWCPRFPPRIWKLQIK